MTGQSGAPDGAQAMTPTAFLALGAPNLAYVRPVVVDGEPGFGIHSADGEMLAVMGDRDTAFAAARQHDLDPVSVH